MCSQHLLSVRLSAQGFQRTQACCSWDSHLGQYHGLVGTVTISYGRVFVANSVSYWVSCHTPSLPIAVEMGFFQDNMSPVFEGPPKLNPAEL